MSKAFISRVLQHSTEVTAAAANRAANDLIDAIVKEMKKTGKFTLPSFGTFTVRKTKARKALNPRTGESIKVKACQSALNSFQVMECAPALYKAMWTDFHYW